MYARPANKVIRKTSQKFCMSVIRLAYQHNGQNLPQQTSPYHPNMVVWSQLSRVGGDTISLEAIQAYHVVSACIEHQLVTASGPKSLILSSLAKYQQTATASSRAIPVVASRASIIAPSLADVFDKPRLSHEPSPNPPSDSTLEQEAEESEPIFCICRRPDDGMLDVECDNVNCLYKRFHGSCLARYPNAPSQDGEFNALDELISAHSY